MQELLRLYPTVKMKSAIAAASIFAAVASAKKCQELTVPVNVAARNGVFDTAALTPHTEIDITNFILNLAQQGNNYTADVLQGVRGIESTFKGLADVVPNNSMPPSLVTITLLQPTASRIAVHRVPFRS